MKNIKKFMKIKKVLLFTCLYLAIPASSFAFQPENQINLEADEEEVKLLISCDDTIYKDRYQNGEFSKPDDFDTMYTQLYEIDKGNKDTEEKILTETLQDLFPENEINKLWLAKKYSDFLYEKEDNKRISDKLGKILDHKNAKWRIKKIKQENEESMRKEKIKDKPDQNQSPEEENAEKNQITEQVNPVDNAVRAPMPQIVINLVGTDNQLERRGPDNLDQVIGIINNMENMVGTAEAKVNNLIEMGFGLNNLFEITQYLASDIVNNNELLKQVYLDPITGSPTKIEVFKEITKRQKLFNQEQERIREEDIYQKTVKVELDRILKENLRKKRIPEIMEIIKSRQLSEGIVKAYLEEKKKDIDESESFLDKKYECLDSILDQRLAKDFKNAKNIIAELVKNDYEEKIIQEKIIQIFLNKKLNANLRNIEQVQTELISLGFAKEDFTKFIEEKQNQRQNFLKKIEAKTEAAQTNIAKPEVAIAKPTFSSYFGKFLDFVKKPNVILTAAAIIAIPVAAIIIFKYLKNIDCLKNLDYLKIHAKKIAIKNTTPLKINKILK